MKIISEKTNKTYATVEECLAAEKAYDEKIAAEKQKQERLEKNKKLRYDEVEAACKKYSEARDYYRDLLMQYIKDYGEYKTEQTDNFIDMVYSLFF